MDEETINAILKSLPKEKHEHFLKTVVIANAIIESAKQTVAIFEEKRLSELN